MCSEWSQQYGNAVEYRWRRKQIDGRSVFYRPLGLVESSFDSDGRYYEGRADMNNLIELKVKSSLSKESLRQRIELAWTCLRCRHSLLRAKAVQLKGVREEDTFAPNGLNFVVDVLSSVQEASADAGKQIVHLEDSFSGPIDPYEFYQHAQNCARIVSPAVALAKLFVFPIEQSEEQSILRFLLVGGHQIWDGLTSYIWNRDFIELLNQTPKDLENRIIESIDPETIERALPLPQEALYPSINGSVARQRWFWAITRILRHVRKPLPVGFSNPLERSGSPREAFSLSPIYYPALDYSKTPPSNTFTLFTRVSRKNTERLQRLCREAKASVGSGCFALVALIMMEMHEAREPDVKLEDRKCFISGFPLDPRAFFNHRSEPDSLMLAFNDGIALPFLSSSLSLDGRIKLLARQAHRQLASYQKRARPQGEEAKMQHLNSRGAGLVLANQYLSSIGRADSALPRDQQRGISPQGGYPIRTNPTPQTCGVSSIGRQDALIKGGVYDLNDNSKDFVADLFRTNASVRAREGEFLVGIGGTENGLSAGCSIHVNTMDPALVEKWRQRFEHVLDDPNEANHSKL